MPPPMNNERAVLVWITAGADHIIEKLARVSNPSAQDRDPGGLIRYMLRHQHWSPFEMASMAIEIHTTRDIGRQILRHVSFRFQEFSQRYADATSTLPRAHPRAARARSEKNRQSSVPNTLPQETMEWWHDAQLQVQSLAERIFKEASERGIANEVARTVLPEGLTMTRMFMVGNIRSWLHFCALRMHPDTQLETRQLATYCWDLLALQMPVTCLAFRDALREGLHLPDSIQEGVRITISSMDAGLLKIPAPPSSS
jgi:thymidylate synthase (FAD)